MTPILERCSRADVNCACRRQCAKDLAAKARRHLAGCDDDASVAAHRAVTSSTFPSCSSIHSPFCCRSCSCSRSAISPDAAKKFDANQVKGINELALDFALPAIMFVGIVKTAAHPPRGETVFLIATTLALVAFYACVVLFSLSVLRRSLGVAALQACLLSFPSVAFMGFPIFKGLFGGSGLLSVTSATAIANLTVAPLTVLLLEIHAARARQAGSDGQPTRLGERDGRGAEGQRRQAVGLGAARRGRDRADRHSGAGSDRQHAAR